MPFVLVLVAWVQWAEGSESWQGRTYYFGDLHAHTTVSFDGHSSEDGDCPDCGALADVFTIARANELDFVALSEHVNISDPVEFDSLLARVLSASDPTAGFLTVPGAELYIRLGEESVGHKNVYLFADDADLLGLSMAELRPPNLEACDDLWDFLSGLAAARGDLLLFPHHSAPVIPEPTDWTCHDEVWAPGVEVYSQKGTSLREGGWDEAMTGSVPTGTVQFALDLGHRFAFLGGTDSHDTRPGSVCSPGSGAVDEANELFGGSLTAVVVDDAREWTRAAIHDAIVERATYATSGPMLPATVVWRSSDGAVLGGLGADIAVPVDGDLLVEVSVPPTYAAIVTAVVLVTDAGDLGLADVGGGVWTVSVAPADLPTWAYPQIELDGASWYGDEGCVDGGDDDLEYLWLSPSRFEMGPGTDDTGGVHPLDSGPVESCGCATGWAPGRWLALALLAALGLRRR